MAALIFDFDGLIVDSERLLGDCVIELLAEVGARVSFEDFGHLFGSIDVDHEWDRLLGVWSDNTLTLADLEERLTPMYRPRADALPLLPGVEPLVAAATRAGWALGLATGQNRDRLLPRLERLGLADTFGAIVTRAEVPNGKPAPDIFLATADRLGADPAKCIVLEDSVPGCEAAIAAGMRVVVCPSPATGHCEFPAQVRRVESLEELSLTELAADL